MRAGTTEIVLKRGDITQETVGAIVNAANALLVGGGGVDGAIHAAGGPEILAACEALPERPGGRCPPGEAVATTAGKLAAEIVVHTVGPIWRGGESGEPDRLARCYRNSLTVAAARGVRTIAFPSISTGAYGYPVADAAATALRAVAGWLREVPGQLDEVRFVLFTEDDLAAYRAAASALEAEGIAG